MEIKRKQRIKGRKAKHYKEWYSPDKHYRISWRNQFEGASVDPAYYACVRCLRGESKYWNFAGRRGTHRTLKAAQKACEYNKKIWDKFLAIEGQAKVRQFKALQAEVFWVTDTNSTLWNVPVWVLARASIRLLEILCGKDTSDHTETSPSSSTPKESAKDPAKVPPKPLPTPEVTNPATSTPADIVVDVVESGSAESSEVTTKAPKKSAKPVKAPVKAPKKSAKKRTAKSSTGGKKKRASTKPSKPQKKKRSKSSRKKKSKPSKS